MATMKVQLKRLRIAPQKVRLVADAIRGLSAQKALLQLSHMEKRSAAPMAKLLSSAIANAKHNLGLDPDNLTISEVYVGEGMTLKRWLPRAHGRATKLLKRTSHITLTLAEIEEGKGRTEPQQKKRMEEAAARTTRDAAASHEHGADAPKPDMAKVAHDTRNKSQGTAAAPKQQMFRRKSS